MIRKGTIEDTEILSKVEATCFPSNEAATSKEIQERLNVYANHFLLLFKENRLISFIDGFCTNQRDLGYPQSVVENTAVTSVSQN